MQISQTHQLIISARVCPYCMRETEHVDSSVVYGKSYGVMLYLCQPCKAWVGTHKSKPKKALGRLANYELRRAKNAAHQAFDPLWQSGLMSRREAYEWLSSELAIPMEYCHIGMFSVKTCQRVVELVNAYNK